MIQVPKSDIDYGLFAGDIGIARIYYALDTLIRLQSMSRGAVGRTVTIGTTPTLIMRSTEPRSLLVSNPSSSLGQSPTGNLIPVATSISSNGNSQATPLGVANYNSAQMLLKVSAVTGAPVVNFYAQVQNPGTLNWIDTQTIFNRISAIGEYYANIGGFGLGTRLAVRWQFSLPGSLTSQLSYILKDGVGGTSVGTSQTIYIGGNGVSTESGYPLLENNERIFMMNENTELYGISSSSVNIRVLEIN